jgi:hypothetical protein
LVQQLAALLVCLVERKGHDLLNLSQGDRDCSYSCDNLTSGRGWLLLIRLEGPMDTVETSEKDEEAKGDQDSGGWYCCHVVEGFGVI